MIRIANAPVGGFNEDPPDGTFASKQFRMWGQFDLSATCTSSGVSQVRVWNIQSDGGHEIAWYYGPVDPLFVRTDTTMTPDGIEANVFTALTGQLNPALEFTVRGVRPRTTTDIYQNSTFSVKCIRGEPTAVQVKARGSAFPSHKIWINDVSGGTNNSQAMKPQGYLRELWRLPPVRFRAFEQTGADGTTSGRSQQVGISDDGQFRWVREFDLGVHGGWSPWWVENNNLLGVPNNPTIGSYSHNLNPQSIPKDDVLSEDGETLYSRFAPNNIFGPWQALPTSTLLGWRGPIRVFEHHQADASGPAKQVAFMPDGFNIYSREYSGSWGPWSLQTVATYNLPAQWFPKIRSVTRSIRPIPPFEPKEDALTDLGLGGQLLGTRFYNGSWGTWRTISVTELGIPGAFLP